MNRCVFCSFKQIFYTFGTVNDRFCIWHRTNRCNSTPRCCLSTRFNSLLVLKSGFSQMYMQINKSRHNSFSLRIYFLCIASLHYTVSNFLYFSIFYKNISFFINIICRIYQPAIFYKNFFHNMFMPFPIYTESTRQISLTDALFLFNKVPPFQGL